MRISDWSSDVCSSDLLFQIATGDGEDADHHAQSNLPGAQRKANKAQEAASAPDPWSGPLGKMQLKAEMRELSKRMNGNALGTTGDLEAVQEEYADVIEQAKRDLPDWWQGYDDTRKRLQATLMVGPASHHEEAAE